MVRNKLILIFLLIATGTSDFLAQTNTMFWVSFTDKNGSPFSISNPSQFLSSRAIARRTKQSIPISTDDIPVNATYLQQVQNAGGTIIARSKWFNAATVKIPNSSVLTAIQNLPFVQSVNPVARYKREECPIETVNYQPPTSPSQKTQASRFNYGNATNQITMIGGECLHNQFYDGTGMVISVIDNGFYGFGNFPELTQMIGSGKILGCRDFLTRDTNVFNDGSHGTAVLSCMAAYNNGSMVGTAPMAKYWLLRTEIDSTEKILEEHLWVSAMEFSDSVGTDVVNSSLGYTDFDDPSQNHTWASLDGKTSFASRAATIAARKGMIVCNSAGNYGSGGWKKIVIPADADSILAVGSVDYDRNLSAFSSRGNSADGRIKPDVCAQGELTYLCNPWSGNLAYSNGTSFSSPVMAGMVACLWQANPTKTNMEIIQAIKESASQYTTPDSLKGYGIPDFCKAQQNLSNTFVNENTIEIFGPNPFYNELIIYAGAIEDFTVEILITDAIGRKILSQSYKVNRGYKQKITIQTEELSRGTYIVHVKGEGKKWSKKLIHQ